MSEMKLAMAEEKFAELIWKHAPIPSGELVRLAKEELGWTKSTTYTVLRKLCARGIFRNEESTVTALVTRAEFDAIRSEEFVRDTFSGSLPAFIAAFASRQTLSPDQVAQIRAMIDQMEEAHK